MDKIDFPKLKHFPPPEKIRPKLKLITSAHHALGELKGRMKRDVINPSLIISPLLTKEAVASSKIEGTQTTVEEVLKYEAEQRREEDSDLLEVINYRRAIYRSLDFLNQKPLGEHVIKNLHQILLESVRGKERDPGNYRRNPVHLGRPGSSPEEAEYVPPNPNEIPDLMKNWVEFIYKEEMDELIRAGIAHYQFEAIHPFLDGNGRIGRLLIPLQLYQKEILPYPYLYVSEYFEKNREEYYYCLRHVDRKRAWENWISFFLTAIRETCEEMQNKILKMYELYSRIKEELPKMNSQYAQIFLDLIFERPVIASTEIVNRLEQPSNQTIYNLIEKFENEKIIHETTGKKRNKVYAFRELLEIIG